MDLKNPIHIKDLRLRKVIDDHYRINAKVGSGSTADAIRKELATGELTGGTFHMRKGKNDVAFLKKWLHMNPTATPGDRAIAENVLLDLQDALGERVWYSRTTAPK